MRVTVTRELEMVLPEQVVRQLNITKQLWSQADCVQQLRRSVSISTVCTKTKETTAYHVKYVENSQSGDVDFVTSQCAQKGRRDGMEGSAYFDTTAMNSLECREATTIYCIEWT